MSVMPYYCNLARGTTVAARRSPLVVSKITATKLFTEKVQKVQTLSNLRENITISLFVNGRLGVPSVYCFSAYRKKLRSFDTLINSQNYH